VKDEPLTDLLHRWRAGELAARDRLLTSVHAELCRLATQSLRREGRSGRTPSLQPPALVNELYLRVAGGLDVPWQNRAHFFAVAAQSMRRILVDRARRSGSQKRAGKLTQVSLDDDVLAGPAPPSIDVLALDAALGDLSLEDEQMSRAVELRYFGGMTIEETAEALSVSPATVKRDLTYAKAWLYDRLQETHGPGSR
jgi:RNA polymerase sigma-70 factor, ECF subfamily